MTALSPTAGTLSAEVLGLAPAAARDVDAFALLEASPTPVVVTGWDAAVRYVNEAAECLLGVRREVIVGRPAREAFPGQGGSELDDALGAAIRGRSAASLQAFVPPAGRWMEVDAHPTPDGLAIFLRDLTRTREALAALRESEQWGALVFDASSDAMVLVEVGADGSLVIRSANAAFERRHRRPRAQLEDRPLEAVFPRAVFAVAHARFEEALHRCAPVSYFDDLTDPVRGRIVVEVTITPVVDEVAGRCTHLLAVVHDVSARTFAEEEQRRLASLLQQAQKMDAMGRLAGGVAHDFNNMLTAIKCNCELLLEEPSLGTEARDDVAEIARTADRAASLTRQLLAFSRKQALEPRVFDLNGVVEGVERMLRRLIVGDVTLVQRPSAEPCLVRADAAQLEQVLVNLALNGRDAMPDGGALTIETRRETLGQPVAHSHGVVPAGRYVVLAVTDSGVGIGDDVLSHLFEPFFTTKSKGQGTGLGLSTVYGIVRQCGGHVVVRSAPERGSCFSVFLPEADSEG